MKRQGTRPIYTSLLVVLVTLGAAFGVIALSSSAGAAATHSSTAGTAKGATTSSLEVCNIASDTGQIGQTRTISQRDVER